MNFPGPTAYSVPGFGHRREHPRRQSLDVRRGVRRDLDELALHHRHRALIVLHRARADEREDVVVARLLHRVALVEDLRVVVLEHEPAPVDPAEAVAELDERVDRTVDAGRRYRDDTRLVGDDTDRDRRVGDTPVGGCRARDCRIRTRPRACRPCRCHRRDRRRSWSGQPRRSPPRRPPADRSRVIRRPRQETTWRREVPRPETSADPPKCHPAARPFAWDRLRGIDDPGSRSESFLRFERGATHRLA